MAQSITDYVSFLTDAKSAVTELSEMKKKETLYRDEEERAERSLGIEKRQLKEQISTTITRRRQELQGSYDEEISKANDKLKKARAKREKAKNQGIKERIAEETAELEAYNRELVVRMNTLFKTDRVPFYCKNKLFYALYYPRTAGELLVLLLAFALCFLALPFGIYMAVPKQGTAWLILIYAAVLLVVGGLYVAIGNSARDKHGNALREGKTIRGLISSNNRKMKVIVSGIRRDRNDSVYDLGKYDDEISQLTEELEQISSKKKEALNTFENVTKNIITDEIAGNSQEKLDSLEASYKEWNSKRKSCEAMVKEKNIYITDTYAGYLGKEFLEPAKIDQLIKLIESGEAINLSDAISLAHDGKK